MKKKIKQIGAIIRLALNEIGAIIITLIGVLGIIQLLIEQFKNLF